VVPNDVLAREAGLACHDRGGILVDEGMRTSDPDIFAAGDCVVVKNQISGSTLYLPMGSMANRQGRVVGTNLAGGDARFEGAVGSWVCKIFESSMAGAGMSLETALMSDYDAMSVLLVQLDRAHFYPTKELMTLELVVDRTTRQILGIQGFGSAGDAMVGRINAVAATLKYRPTVADISNLEMAYSPPFSSAVDILNTLANMADNALAGLNRGVGPDKFRELWNERESGRYFFLDCREAGDANKYMEKHPAHWHNIPQGQIYERLDEIPRDRDVILVCNTGARSYEAQIMLDHKGVRSTNLHGGMAALKKWGGEP
jgi:rhodanese-related sulfurtransferase